MGEGVDDPKRRPGIHATGTARRLTVSGKALVMTASLLTVGLPPLSASTGLPSWMDCKGYVDYTELIVVSQKSPWWTTGAIAQNRIELSLYPLQTLTVSAALRSRLLYGNLYERIIQSGYDKALGNDAGLMDLSANLWHDSSALFNVMSDRLYLDFSPGEWQFRLGRHRINWGKNLIWNPNDIFNARSIFDVAYREGPGTDALLVRRYLGPMANVEMVVAGARDIDSVTAAALGQISYGGFDMQLLAGWMRHTVVGGAGYSGQVGGAALRGEASVFAADSFDSRPQAVVSLSAEYTFPRQIWVHLSSLFNSEGRKSPAGGFESRISTRLSAQHLSEAMFQLFVQASCPVTPLITTDCSAVINPADGSAMLMPLISFSLSDNAQVTFQAQIKIGRSGDQYGGKEHIIFGNLQWSF
ncbi:MAG: hypothetical protein JW913_18195 [Chitinispirillaceae bacterium]|nr:hypothetical protein [Chitinispirillaceae bacterium]